MLLLWLSALLTLAGLAGLLLALVLFGIARWRGRKSYRTIRAFGGLALACLALGLLLGGLPRLVTHLTSQGSEFAEAFGVSPPPGLRHLETQDDRGFDFVDIFIGMDADSAARALLADRFGAYPRSEESDLAGGLVFGGDTPDWWHGGPAWLRRGKCDSREAHELRDWQGWRTVVVVDCRSDGRIYLLFSRID